MNITHDNRLKSTTGVAESWNFPAMIYDRLQTKNDKMKPETLSPTRKCTMQDINTTYLSNLRCEKLSLRDSESAYAILSLETCP